MKSKRVVVTGGTMGIGQKTVEAFLREGASVVFTARNENKAQDLLSRYSGEAAAGRLAFCRADVSSEQDVKNLLAFTNEKLGGCDILINNAGRRPGPAPSSQMSRRQWDATIALNATGPFITCGEAVRRWLAEGHKGRIVNVASPVAFRGTATGHADYGASKAALVNFTKSLALEVAAKGIHVNGVAPGMMYTDMSVDDLKYDMPGYLEKTPLGRISDPAEIANIVVFMASARASYMTGTTVNVSGGLLMR